MSLTGIGSGRIWTGRIGPAACGTALNITIGWAVPCALMDGAARWGSATVGVMGVETGGVLGAGKGTVPAGASGTAMSATIGLVANDASDWAATGVV